MGLDITKGAWSPRHAIRIPLSTRYKANVLKGSTIKIVATVFGETKKEAEANARLIAAAPELLETLEFCKSVIEKQGMFDQSERMAFDKATAVLNKAK